MSEENAGENRGDTARIRVAYQGERGAFSEEAAVKLLGGAARDNAETGVEPVPHRSFEEMFEAVSSEQVDGALAPIENSLAGSIHKNYDLLEEHDLVIIGEVNLRIVHNLIAPPGVRLENLRRVYSHPVALAQCERFFRARTQLEAAPAHDTAGSVRVVMENNRSDEAAIAGRMAAEVYGAHILAEGIEDNQKNFTRFLLLTKPERAGSIKTQTTNTPRKTSIIFRIANKPSSLFRSLAVFALRDIDLMKLESRPIEGRPWEYSFYLDLQGDQEDVNVRRALTHLEEMAESVRVLGSYPSAS